MNSTNLHFILLLELLLATKVLAIIGGEPAWYYPFFVQVVTNGNLCGGTLVAQDAVVTAAHCLRHREENRWAFPKEIRVKKYEQSHQLRAPSVFQCEGYVRHNSYDVILHNGFVPFDIAVIKLAKCLELSYPGYGILKPCSASIQYLQGIAIGAGLTGTNPNIPAKMLMETNLYIYLFCARYLKKYGIEIEEKKQICYGSHSITSHTGLCHGDFGGPIIHLNKWKSGDICLIGVASFSFNTYHDPMLPSVFTSASYFADWIESATEALSAGSSCEILK